MSRPMYYTFTEREKFLIQPMRNSEMGEGLIASQNIHPNILSNKAIVKNEGGRALIMCINTSDDIVKIDAPTIQLEPFEESFKKEGARETHKIL